MLGAGNFIYPYLSARNQLFFWNVLIGTLVSAAIMPVAMRAWRVQWRDRWLVAGCFLAILVLQLAAESWWPNSADEYGYTFLAHTLLRGRLWNPLPPAPEIFEFAWTFMRDGKWFSQYPPGWPALLAPFLIMHAGWLLNPVLTAGLCALLLAVLQRLQVARGAAGPITFLTAFCPFVLFNGASLFPHVMTAVLLMSVLLLQLREVERRQAWNRLGIGALFGVLLLTRYEVFALSAVPFVVARAWRCGRTFQRDAVLMGVGGLPFILVYLLYNRAITGRAFKTPYSWVSPGAHIGFWGKHVVFLDALERAVLRILHWSGELTAFTSLLLIALVSAAIFVKVRRKRLDWYDVLLPVSVVFFFLYPASGGHEFGPRYWFFAWPFAMVTLATGLEMEGEADWLGVARLRLHASGLAVAHVPVFLGMSVATAAFTHVYVDARRQVEIGVPAHRPAVVLIPTRKLWLTPFQRVPLTAHSADFCRNGVDLDEDVLYARADAAFLRAPQFIGRACRFTGRSVYVWRAPGVMDKVDCVRSGAIAAIPVQQDAGYSEYEALLKREP